MRENLRRRRGADGLRGTPAQVCWARRLRGELAARREQITEACEDLAAVREGASAQELAKWYLTHVLRHRRRADWWIANRDYLTAAWFIDEYLRGGLARAYAPPPGRASLPVRGEALLCPQEVRSRGAVEVTALPSGENCARGLLLMRYEMNLDLSRVAREARMRWDKNRAAYVREVDQCAEPLADRAAELCARLLGAGFRVLCTHAEAREKAFSGDYAPEFPRWIRLGPSGGRLEMMYPADPALTSRARSLGARWNGQAMELEIWLADEAEEFARLYGFRISGEARARMDEWRRAVRDARIWSPAGTRGPAGDAPRRDPLAAMLEMPREIPEDLRDDDI